VLAVQWGPLVQADLRIKEDLCRAFERWRPCAVMHFAAYAYVGESTVRPLEYYDNNIGGTAKLLSACAAFDCGNFVFSSSSEGELGDMHDPETHLVPLILFAAMGRHPSVQIFGTDYPTSDGSCIRDYVPTFATWQMRMSPL